MLNIKFYNQPALSSRAGRASRGKSGQKEH